MSDYKERRKEFQSAKFHRQLPLKCGLACVNCGDFREIEYHHIVPLECGGTNNFSNIVPLCRTCHMSVHMTDFMKASRSAKLKKVSGRKRSCPDNYREILDDYLHCRISKPQAEELLGLRSTHKMTDCVWFKEYLDEKNIKGYRNNIAILNSGSNNGVHKGTRLGWIRYNDGTMEEFIA